MFGWFGEFGGTRKNHTSRCLWSLNYLAERKAGETTKIIFRVFNTSNSSPILLFCPRSPKSYFLKHNWGVWGSGKHVETSYELIWLSFELFGHGESPKTHPKSFLRFLALLTRHRFFFLLPEALNMFSSKNTKRRAPENDRDLSCQKLI